MCGIVGIIGQQAVAPRILDALKRLEYRGYDSAGIATLHEGKSGPVMTRRRAEGKLFNLEKRLEDDPLEGTIGIGHTRWATHGAPTEDNAHPHATEKVAIVHNGIIENYKELRAELAEHNILPKTDTDTETAALLVNLYLDQGSSEIEAVSKTLKKLRGAFSLAFIFLGKQDLMIAARRGTPLAIGHGQGEMYLGSDAIALAPFTNTITYLEEGDWAILSREGVQIFDHNDQPVEREATISNASALMVDKGNHRHFMHKEIYEQPEAISHTLTHYLDMTEQTINIHDDVPFDFSTLNRLTISACGTAYIAGLVGKYWFEKYARLPVDIDIASEMRYREAPMEANGLSLFISQSGETADTLAALRYAASQDQTIAAILNTPESTMAREADITFPILCGPEIGVASTKAFTSMLAVLAALTIAAAKQRGKLDRKHEAEMVQSLMELPRTISKALEAEPHIREIAKKLTRYKDVLYLARGQMYPIAMEGALKLKELSYQHAEAYAAGELKHGPIALIDEDMPIVVIAPSDELMEKTISNMQEAEARGGKVILITDEEGARLAGEDHHDIILMPDTHNFTAPIVAAIPAQLLAYHTAVFMGTDVDQPRNLAKSVTVE